MKYCYICGKIEDYVNLLIAAQDIYLCDECIHVMYDIVKMNEE